MLRGDNSDWIAMSGIIPAQHDHRTTLKCPLQDIERTLFSHAMSEASHFQDNSLENRINNKLLGYDFHRLWRKLMTDRTQFLSRLWGLYCLIVGISMIVHREAMLETITALVHDGSLMFVIGVMIVFAGLAMVLVHNVWSGGAHPVIVTLIGWTILLKGTLLLILPPDAAVDFYLGTLRYAQWFYVYAGISVVLGAYLSYAGFRAANR
jgi:hypothetical protein